MKNSKVFVTGADGFIGSHLCEALVYKGYKVKALVAYNSFGNIGWLENVDRQIKSSLEVMFPWRACMYFSWSKTE